MEKQTFQGIYLVKSKGKNGQLCWVGKHRPTKNDRVTIIICDEEVAKANNIPFYGKGRFNVEVVPMKKAHGFLVTAAEYAYDDIWIRRDGFKVIPFFNGRQEKLKTEDGKFISLVFDPENYYDPEIIEQNLRRKLKYMQIHAEQGFEEILENFREEVKVAEKDYNIHVKSQFNAKRQK